MTNVKSTSTVNTTKLTKILAEGFLIGFVSTAGMIAAFKVFQVASSPVNRRAVREATAKLLNNTAERIR